MSNQGKWAPWYTANSSTQPYGDTTTYHLAEDALSGLAVEDWGCGFGWFRTVHAGPYLGVDGTDSPHADVVDELSSRDSTTPGLLLRHVLEHNTGWADILANAVRCTTGTLVVVVFTPDGRGQQIGWTDIIGVPDLAVPHAHIRDILRHAFTDVTETSLTTATQYGVETVWVATNRRAVTG